MPGESVNSAGTKAHDAGDFKQVNAMVSPTATKVASDMAEKVSVQSSEYKSFAGETTRFGKIVDSFRRAPSSPSSNMDAEAGKNCPEGKESNLRQTIKTRHVIMMSLGTGIGTGMLVGNGKALHNGGPAGLVIGYAIIGTCVYCIIQAAGELAVAYATLNGGFNAYPSILVDPGLNFAVAWVYCLQWLVVMPLELVTASITIKYWTTSVNPDAFVAIFYVLLIAINIFGARGYAEAEFFFNMCKVLMIAGFFILGIIVNCGGAGNGGYLGGKYWHDPGAFNGDRGIDHLKGIVATMVTAAFAFGATEFIALTAAEQANPRRAIPSAAKKVLYRILVIFLGSIVLIGVLVPYNSDELMGSGSSATHASPYVIAIASHGVRVVPHFINAVILLSVLSVGNSAYYSSSRLLLSLAEQGYAPSFLTYVDRAGRPLMAMIVGAVIGLISFVAASPKEETVFTWLLAISGLSQLFTWISICLSHVRFRRALKVQGRSTGELGYMSQTGVYGSWYAVIMMSLVLIGQFWIAIKPVGSSKLDVNSFFENYLAVLILMALYFGYKLITKDWRLFIRAEHIDLISHRKIFDEDLLKQEDAEYKAKVRSAGWLRRVAEIWC
ncbi:LAMI_0F01420g1_1 [Lachancea mirantina]|uniref:LAMI_0F01420g1_1 n=1 Tax=Lachancea mirantina TaxID=1230905 RepID=A0A1G4JW43_9SACH|nr:LAMI_0F01420g1_1 [Lachancea mirantina]